MSKRLSICLTCSHGGHLTEMRLIEPAFEGHDTFYICYDASTTRVQDRAYLIPNMARNPIELIKNLFRTLRIFMKERPDLIVSTGAEIALPVVTVGKAFGARIVYIECGAQVTDPSFTGRIMSRVADAFFVQWPELIRAYGKHAQLRGSCVDETAPFPGDRSADARAEIVMVIPPAAGPVDESAPVLASILQQRGYTVRVIDAPREKLDVTHSMMLVQYMRPAAVILIGEDSHLLALLQDTTRAADPPPVIGWGTRGEHGVLLNAQRGDYEGVIRVLAETIGSHDLDALPIDSNTPPDWPLFGRQSL